MNTHDQPVTDLYFPFSNDSSQKRSYFLSSEDWTWENLWVFTLPKHYTLAASILWKTYQRRRKFCTGDGIRREEFSFMFWPRAQRLDVCWCTPSCGRSFLSLRGLGVPLPHLAGLARSQGSWSCRIFGKAQLSSFSPNRWWNWDSQRWNGTPSGTPQPQIPELLGQYSLGPQQTPWWVQSFPLYWGNLSVCSWVISSLY